MLKSRERRLECGPPCFWLSTSEQSLTDHFSFPASPHLPKRPCRASLSYCGKAPRQRGFLPPSWHLKDESQTQRAAATSPVYRDLVHLRCQCSSSTRARAIIKCTYSGRPWLNALFVCVHFTLQIIEDAGHVELWERVTLGAVLLEICMLKSIWQLPFDLLSHPRCIVKAVSR